MGIINRIPAISPIGSAVFLSFFLLGGCADFPKERRYDETEKIYSSPQVGIKSTLDQNSEVTAHYVSGQDEKTKIYQSPQSGVKYTTGQYDGVTSHYIATDNENAKIYSSPQSGVKSTAGKYDDVTAHYTLRQGGRSAPQTNIITVVPEKQPVNLPMVLQVTDVLFDFDKWVIKTRFISELDQWVDYFKTNPEVTAVIYGHTDSTGSTTYNQNLSMKRAQAIINYLIREGVDPDRLTAKGFGETQPAASNNTVEGRQKNRRVEIDF